MTKGKINQETTTTTIDNDMDISNGKATDEEVAIFLSGLMELTQTHKTWIYCSSIEAVNVINWLLNNIQYHISVTKAYEKIFREPAYKMALEKLFKTIKLMMYETSEKNVMYKRLSDMEMKGEKKWTYVLAGNSKTIETKDLMNTYGIIDEFKLKKGLDNFEKMCRNRRGELDTVTSIPRKILSEKYLEKNVEKFIELFAISIECLSGNIPLIWRDILYPSNQGVTGIPSNHDPLLSSPNQYEGDLSSMGRAQRPALTEEQAKNSKETHKFIETSQRFMQAVQEDHTGSTFQVISMKTPKTIKNTTVDFLKENMPKKAGTKRKKGS